MLKINDDIYYIGAINPTLRVFDIIMKTEYGTTYNAYLIKDVKNVLIETVHEKFFDEYLESIEEIIPIEKIDYLILNHTEPDHTGSVRKLLEKNPNITIITTMAGKNFVSNICNMDFSSQVVKDGDILNIGSRSLEFIVAPLLHWPDSMFTYSKSDKILFSCDFLGTHYAEPKIFDKYVKYPEKYEESLLYYFNAIFGPFKPNVLYGLSRIENLDLSTICPSHGPILQETFPHVINQYKTWASEIKLPNKKVTIFYVSAYGYTKKLANFAKEFLEKNGITVEIFNVIHSDISEIISSIHSSDGILVGSPTINRDALKPVWDVLSSIDAISNKGKLCGVFGSYGWSGEAVPMIKQRLESLKLKVLDDGVKVLFNPNKDDMIKMEEYINKFVQMI